MYIGEAIEAVHQGAKVTRETWTKGKFIYMVPAQTVDFENLRVPAKDAVLVREKFEGGVSGSARWINPHIDMINEFGAITCGWTATADDLFASDWHEVSPD